NPRKQKDTHFTGFVSGDQSVLSHSLFISGALANKVLTPPLHAYNHLKQKLNPEVQLFEEEELNEWYKYYKAHGTYPDYLDKKYQEKYPNLNDIFTGKAQAVASTPDVESSPK